MVCLAAFVVGPAAMAADVVVARPVDLRADRYIDAATVAQLAAGAHVDLIETEAGWVHVRSGARTGWVRASGLVGDGASVASLARLDSGRSATGNVVVAAGIRRIPKASRHALLIGVDAIDAEPSQRWPGVADDVASARLVAQRLGVPDANVDAVVGADATFDGIGAAIDRLVERVQPGDQVMVWYAGAGASVGASGHCLPAWATRDGRAWTAPALAQKLSGLLDRVDRLLVVSDAAFVSTAPAGRLANGATRRTATALGRQCTPEASPSLPIVDEAVALGGSASRLVSIQSAAGPLQGVEQARGGGLFTQALADCFLGDAIDTDGSGSLSIAEVAACVDGGRGVRSRVDGNASWSPIVGIVAAASATSPKVPARSVIDDVHAQRDARIAVTMVATPPSLAIGRDFLDLRVTSSRAGFVYLVQLGSDGRTFTLLFPNDLDRDNRIAAGATLALPRPNWRVQAQGPAGTDTVLAIVAEAPRDLTVLGDRKDGPFSLALADGDGRARLQWLLGRSGQAGAIDCVEGGTRRNLGAVAVCSDAYGSAVTEIVER